jgi:hypothetical protein
MKHGVSTVPRFLVDGPEDAAAVLILAHGAGAPMDSPFLGDVARDLGAAGIRVVRFEFPYMRERRETGRRRPPDREAVLLGEWREVFVEVAGASPAGRPRPLVGGKSLGGRMASMVADELGARGLVCLGYPFHPPGKPDRLRTRHLETLATPALVIQGERDPFGRREEVASYRLSPAIRVHWIAEGDHSYEPPRRAGGGGAANRASAVAAVVEFVRALP